MVKFILVHGSSRVLEGHTEGIAYNLRRNAFLETFWGSRSLLFCASLPPLIFVSPL